MSLSRQVMSLSRQVLRVLLLANLSIVPLSVGAQTPQAGTDVQSFAAHSRGISLRSIKIDPGAVLDIDSFSYSRSFIVRFDLNDFEKRMWKLADKLEITDECGENFKVTRLTVIPQNDIFIDGSISYEKWHCIITKIPEYRGLKVVFKRKLIGRVKLKSYQSRICTSLSAGFGKLGIQYDPPSIVQFYISHDSSCNLWYSQDDLRVISLSDFITQTADLLEEIISDKLIKLNSDTNFIDLRREIPSIGFLNFERGPKGPLNFKFQIDIYSTP